MHQIVGSRVGTFGRLDLEAAQLALAAATPEQIDQLFLTGNMLVDLAKPGAIFAPYAKTSSLPTFFIPLRAAEAMGWEDGQVVSYPIHVDPPVRIPAIVRISHEMPGGILADPARDAKPVAPRRVPGERVDASDRMYQVGVDGEFHRIGRSSSKRRRRLEARRQRKGT